MSDNKAMKLLLFFVSIVVLGFIIDAFILPLLQVTNTAIQSANGNGFRYLDGLLIAIPIIVIVAIVLLKLDEFKRMF